MDDTNSVSDVSNVIDFFGSEKNIFSCMSPSSKLAIQDVVTGLIQATCVLVGLEVGVDLKDQEVPNKILSSPVENNLETLPASGCAKWNSCVFQDNLTHGTSKAASSGRLLASAAQVRRKCTSQSNSSRELLVTTAGTFSQQEATCPGVLHAAEVQSGNSQTRNVIHGLGLINGGRTVIDAETSGFQGFGLGLDAVTLDSQELSTSQDVTSRSQGLKIVNALTSSSQKHRVQDSQTSMTDEGFINVDTSMLQGENFAETSMSQKVWSLDAQTSMPQEKMFDVQTSVSQALWTSDAHTSVSQKMLTSDAQTSVSQKMWTSDAQTSVSQKMWTSDAQTSVSQKMWTSDAQTSVSQKMWTSDAQTAVSQKIWTSDAETSISQGMFTSDVQTAISQGMGHSDMHTSISQGMWTCDAQTSVSHEVWISKMQGSASTSEVYAAVLPRDYSDFKNSISQEIVDANNKSSFLPLGAGASLETQNQYKEMCNYEGDDEKALAKDKDYISEQRKSKILLRAKEESVDSYKGDKNAKHTKENRDPFQNKMCKLDSGVLASLTHLESQHQHQRTVALRIGLSKTFRTLKPLHQNVLLEPPLKSPSDEDRESQEGEDYENY